MDLLTQKEIETEVQGYISNPAVLESEPGYPYWRWGKNGDRQFEILMYQIYKRRIDRHEFVGQYDDVRLMRGTKERGRDLVLYLDGKVVGVVQCKFTASQNHKFHKAAVAKEIIKFSLYALMDSKLAPYPSQFDYVWRIAHV